MGAAPFYRKLHLTKAEARALLGVLHLDGILGGTAAPSSHEMRLETMKRLARRGLVTEVRAQRVDSEGFVIYPERWGRAFLLTAKGRALAARVAEGSLGPGSEDLATRPQPRRSQE